MESRVLNLSENELLSLESDTRDHALCTGLIQRSRIIKNDSICELQPITLFPTPFPRAQYEQAKDVQLEINLIIHRIANDNSFLTECLSSIQEVDDPATKCLFSIHEDVRRTGRAQEKSLGLFRSDYMLDDRSQRLLQVEVHTISASMAGLTPSITERHKANLSKCGANYDANSFPDKNTSDELANGLLAGLEAYGNFGSTILFVVDENAIDLSDQKHIEFSIRKLNSNATCIRRTFRQLEDELRLDENRLLFAGNLEIGVVYFRSHAHSIADHTSANNVKLRTKIELSKAIKCPTIQHQLAGAKQIQQQILADQDVLRRFCTNNESLEKVYSTIAGVWPLSLDEKGDRAIELALNDPTKYVLRSQR